MAIEIEHLTACHQRLLGLVAQAYGPVVTFNLRNLEVAADAMRRTGLDPKCECARLMVARVDTTIATARKQTKFDLVTELRSYRRDVVLAAEELDERRRKARERAAAAGKPVTD